MTGGCFQKIFSQSTSVPWTRTYSRPSGGLEDPSKALNYDEIKHRVDVFGLCIAEGVTEEPGEQHSERQEVAKRDPLCNHAREEHGDRVADEETRVKKA